MRELNEIRAKKLEELRNIQRQRASEQNQEDLELQQQIKQLETIVKQAMTKEALERYGNFKTAFPEMAVKLIVLLAQAIQRGQIKKIDDELLKQILKKISPKQRDIKISRA